MLSSIKSLEGSRLRRSKSEALAEVDRRRATVEGLWSSLLGVPPASSFGSEAERGILGDVRVSRGRFGPFRILHQ